MSLSNDFVEFVELLSKHRVEYMLVGGHALAFHGLPRFTKDIDFWIRPTPENAERILGVLGEFGFGEVGLTALDFTIPGKVIQLGQAPNRIDLVTSVDGIEFDECFGNRITTKYREKPLDVIGKEDLIANKKASGREQDLLDVKMLLKQ